MHDSDRVCDAWNPGLTSEIPKGLLPLVTLYRAENSEVDYAQAKEMAELCGLEAKDTIAFRVERLIVHELLIRVTSDLTVPDGPNYEDLGISLRSMTSRILGAYIQPQLDEIRARFDTIRQEADGEIRRILDSDIFSKASSADAGSKPGGLFKRLLGKAEQPIASGELVELAALTRWREELRRGGDQFQSACLRSLVTVVGGIIGRRGRLMADRDMIAKIALNLFGNTFGSGQVGKMIEPIMAEAAKGENYRFLPTQEKPFFMNVKGASAAGKSTIRPAQRALAGKLGIPWEDFALISPDYWRKFLLDYDSLGEDYKYAAMLTGQELEIIDKKLDRYMEAKAANKTMPHLLIDRFRFDSFDVSQFSGKESQLLTRFGDTVFLFFIITPPAETVERSWKRGLATGRYKAVDDLLYHNMEAYTGMPNLFFYSVLSTNKKIHFEFLDNSVAFGEKPRTIAFGWNGKMTILDLERLNDITRFQHVNINATRPEEVLTESPERSFDFLKSCLRRIPEIKLADHESSKVYGLIRNGRWIFKDPSVLKMYGDDSLRRKCLRALGWDHPADGASSGPVTLDVEAEQHFTLGDWGGTA
jgi:hypothetical protein